MAAANAQVPDSDDEELGVPLGQQPAASSASVPVTTNPFPLNSPAGSPTNDDPARALGAVGSNDAIAFKHSLESESVKIQMFSKDF